MRKNKDIEFVMLKNKQSRIAPTLFAKRKGCVRGYEKAIIPLCSGNQGIKAYLYCYQRLRKRKVC